MTRRSFRRDADGQVMVLVALLIVAMLLSVSLAIDTGRLFVARRDVQTAADAGAWSGAVVLYNGGSRSAVIAAASAAAGLNGYTTGGPTTVAVNVPPLSGPHASDSRYVEVLITTQVPAWVTPTGPRSNLVGVRAVGSAVSGPSGYAVMALNQSATPNALYVQAPGTLAVSGGGIQTNSSSATALVNQGAVTVTPTTQLISVVGGASGTFPPGQLRTGQPVVSDPLATLPKPSTAGLTNWGAPVCCVLNPGIYTGPISSASGVWTLNPGVYILAGGGISLTGSARLSGTGVFLFLTTSTYPAAGGACGAFNLASTAVSTLSPMTTGSYPNLLLDQDPACSNQLIVTSDGGLSGSGTLYAPTAVCEFDAAVSVSQVICDKIVVESHTLTVNYAGGSSAQGLTPALVE